MLHGVWRIAHLRPARIPDESWAEATELRLESEVFWLRTQAPEELAGTWQLQRHLQLGQPFLVLYLPAGPLQALVTRLRHSPDGELRQMVLYFQSGLELQLTHP